MTTHPEIRPDKNGNFVTRHIKNFVAGSKTREAPAPVVLGELVTCGFCSVQFNRGTPHSCRVRNLVNLTPAAKKVLAA